LRSNLGKGKQRRKLKVTEKERGIETEEERETQGNAAPGKDEKAKSIKTSFDRASDSTACHGDGSLSSAHFASKDARTSKLADRNNYCK
jgi:hypothetical protein